MGADVMLNQANQSMPSDKPSDLDSASLNMADSDVTRTGVTKIDQAESHGADLFENEQLSNRYDQLVKTFRCVTCPNQNIADSHAPVAISMREEILRQLSAGKDTQEISDYLLMHYGDYVSYRPLFTLKNAGLWCGPVLILLLGCYLWMRLIKAKRCR